MYKKITNWETFNNLILNLSNQMYVRWYASISKTGQKHLEFLSHTPMTDNAPLWNQLKEMGIDHLESEQLDNKMYRYFFVTKYFETNE